MVGILLGEDVEVKGGSNMRGSSCTMIGGGGGMVVRDKVFEGWVVSEGDTGGLTY